MKSAFVRPRQDSAGIVHRSIFLFLIASCAALSAHIQAAPAESGAGDEFFGLAPVMKNPLPVLPPRVQEGSLTCWSTCAEMVMEFLAGRVRQCHQADPPLPGDPSDCCAENYVFQLSSCDFASLPNFPLSVLSCEFRFESPLCGEGIATEITTV